MPVKNLWGKLPGADVENPPYTILQEQAVLLSEMTNNMIEGQVKHFESGEIFFARLAISVPTLGGYHYTLLEIQHDSQFYPLWISETGTEKKVQCNSANEFTKNLKSILSSDSVLKMIESLLAQNKSPILC